MTTKNAKPRPFTTAEIEHYRQEARDLAKGGGPISMSPRTLSREIGRWLATVAPSKPCGERAVSRP